MKKPHHRLHLLCLLPVGIKALLRSMCRSGLEAMTMPRFEQGTVRTAPEKLTGQETRRSTTHARGAIRGLRCGAVAGTSLHAPMT